MNVETNFLNGEMKLKETIYIKELEGFIIKGRDDKSFNLKKSVYNLNKSFCQRYKTFHYSILEFGYMVNRLDCCVYIMKSGVIYHSLSLH